MSFAQACLGGEIKVPTVYGDETLTVPKGTPSGKVFTLPGKGVKGVHGRGQGDQHVQVVVQVPRKMSEEEAELIRQLGELSDGQVADKEKPLWERWMDKLHGN